MITSPAIQETSQTWCSTLNPLPSWSSELYNGEGFAWMEGGSWWGTRSKVSWLLSLSLLSFVTYLCSDSDKAMDIKTEELSFKNVHDLVRFLFLFWCAVLDWRTQWWASRLCMLINSWIYNDQMTILPLLNFHIKAQPWLSGTLILNPIMQL